MEEIFLLTDEELEKKYRDCSVRGVIISCVKHIRRYGSERLPKDLWLKILFYALTGYDCKKHHLDVAQRISLYEYLKDKDIEDPYLKQFMRESKEALNGANV